jgi:hypothetical protein
MKKIISCLLVGAVLSACGKTQVITHKIVDPDDVLQVSKFNSCCHVAWPSNLSPQVSRKNYLKPAAAYAGTKGQLKVYAPCDGRIVLNDDQLEGCSNGDVRGSDVHIVCKGNRFHGKVVLFHIDLINGLGKGSTIKSGDHIAYVNVSCAGSTESDFDFGYYVDGKPESIWDHMTDDAIAPWTAKGLTRSNIVLPEPSGDCSSADLSSTTVCDSQSVVF